MLIWFIVLAPILVAEIFHSPQLDYRLVACGAALPLVELAFDGPRLLHALVVPVVVMAGVMLAFRGRRIKQRRWLGLPIGLFMHLVLGGAWLEATLFWWPLLGFDVAGTTLPEAARPLGLSLLLDAIGVVAAVWAFRRYQLDEPENRQRMLKSGHLPRSYLD